MRSVATSSLMAICHALENKNALRLHVHLQEKGMKKPALMIGQNGLCNNDLKVTDGI